MEFEELTKNRRSAVKFQEGVTIPRGELESIFEVTKNYPSFFNLQHAHYYVVSSEEKKRLVYEQCGKQYKLLSSSAIVLLCGDKEAHKQVEELYRGMRMLKIIDELEYQEIYDTVTQLYVGHERFREDEAIRNACLSAMIFMLAAKDAGWDTCPMGVRDTLDVRNIFGVKDSHVPVLLIPIGQAVTTKVRPRGYRKPVHEFVHFND